MKRALVYVFPKVLFYKNGPLSVSSTVIPGASPQPRQALPLSAGHTQRLAYRGYSIHVD